MNMRFHLGVCIAITVILLTGGCGGRNTVLVTGFWPPTNEMLTEFSTDPALNPGGWKGQNFQNSGYDVYAVFPVFPDGPQADPKGEGEFSVDYDQALRRFRRLTAELRPAAILCYDQGDADWEIEMNFPLHTHWIPDYQPPTLPLCICHFGYRHNYGDVLHSTFPVVPVAAEVSAAVPTLEIVIDEEGDAGKFVLAYMAFAAADYQQAHDFCHFAGAIRVGADVSAETAKKANQATLKAVVNALGTPE